MLVSVSLCSKCLKASAHFSKQSDTIIMWPFDVHKISSLITQKLIALRLSIQLTNSKSIVLPEVGYDFRLPCITTIISVACMHVLLMFTFICHECIDGGYWNTSFYSFKELW